MDMTGTRPSHPAMAGRDVTWRNPCFTVAPAATSTESGSIFSLPLPGIRILSGQAEIMCRDRAFILVP